MTKYAELTNHIARGWNTWNIRSVLSFVKLPEGLSINLGVKEHRSAKYLSETLIGRKESGAEVVRPGNRSWGGSYIELRVTWQDIEFLVQSTVENDDVIILVTPGKNQRMTSLLVAEIGFLWNRRGSVSHGDGCINAAGSLDTRVFGTAAFVDDPNIPAKSPYFCMEMKAPLGISTGRDREIGEITAAIEAAKSAEANAITLAGDAGDASRAIKTVMAWDTIYDPLNHRVISPVSRLWSVDAGGYVLFDWDTYFAALLASVDNRDMAYANAIAITREITERGFIPNFVCASGFSSLDRSQPPVGSMVVHSLYQRFGDRWLLEEVYDNLLTWNRWWPEHRDYNGYLCWGSESYEPRMDWHWEIHEVGVRTGAALESGLDNSPMYDDMPYDSGCHLMLLADIGLMSFYVRDCNSLADIAAILGKKSDEEELRRRGASYAEKLKALWSDEVGLFLNKRLDSGAFETRLSPTHFYPFLAGVPDSTQAKRMVEEHLFNTSEFWGTWVIPSIARDDPAYEDQDYWRGRIWAPMNFLVYFGLLGYGFPDARRELADKSLALLMKEWRVNGYVCENYNGTTGVGPDRPNSDLYYHWGALLALIYLIEEGHYSLA